MNNNETLYNYISHPPTAFHHKIDHGNGSGRAQQIYHRRYRSIMYYVLFIFHAKDAPVSSEELFSRTKGLLNELYPESDVFTIP